MTSRTRVLLAIVLVAAAIGIGGWYTRVYDTGAAKCERGDYWACQVLADRAAQEAALVAGQEAAASAARAAQLEREAANAAASASVAAAAANAQAATAIADARSLEAERATLGRCYLKLSAHDATIRVSGRGADTACNKLVDQVTTGWEGPDTWQPSSATSVRAVAGLAAACVVPWASSAGDPLTLTVLDTGSASYGNALCRDLRTSPY